MTTEDLAAIIVAAFLVTGAASLLAIFLAAINANRRTDDPTDTIPRRDRSPEQTMRDIGRL